MKSEKFMINSDAEQIAAARCASELFAQDNALGHRDTLRLSLLVEETLGMVRAMVDDFYGRVWFVTTPEAFEVHLEATAKMDSEKRHELLSVSSTGKNISAKGFMGMLGELISDTLYNFGRVAEAYGEETMQCGIVVPPGMDTPSIYDVTPVWSLQTYRATLDNQRAEDAEAVQAWDELEKSIVASLADDVIVGVKGNCIELIIVRKRGN